MEKFEVLLDNHPNIVDLQPGTRISMKQVFLLLLVLISTILQAQSFSAGPDQTICLGESSMLQGTGPTSYTYQWSSVPPDLTISDPTSLTPEIQPSVTTVYTLEGRSVALVNSVVNGNFETGDNTGFTSSYLYMPGPNGSIYNEGTYAITTDASNNHPNFSCNEDHTTGNGYFMAVNGSGTANTIVWEQTINVTPNTDYEFSTWVMSLSPVSPALLQFSINGVLLGQPFQATSTTCDWNMFFEEWNSGSETTATISIVNQNTAGNGNDFSLDDIKFRKVTFYYDDCEVSVVPMPTSDFDLPVESCSADTTIAVFTGSATPTAAFNWDFDGATVISGSGPGPYELMWPIDGQKTVSLMVEDGCPSTVTTKNIDVLQSPAINAFANPQTIPYGTSTKLIGSITGSGGQIDHEWQPEDSIQNPNHPSPNTKPLHATTLFTFTCVNTGNGCVSEDTVTVFVTGGPLGILDFSALPDTICQGDSSTLSVNVGGGSGNYTNTWTSEPPGFNHTGPEMELNVTPTETTTYYISSFDGFSSTEQDSVMVVVHPQIEIVFQPKDTTILFNGIATFTVNTNHGLEYQWQVSSDGGATWTDLSDIPPYSGSQTATLTVTATDAGMNGNLYKCNISGECNPVTSDRALLKVADSPDVIGALESVNVCQFDTIIIPCSLSNFLEIDSFDLVFEYDTALMDFISVTNYHQKLNSLQIENIVESITLNWSDTIGTTISDGVFFDFWFLALKGGSDSLVFKEESILKNSYGFYPDINLTSSQISITDQPIGPDSAYVYPDSLNILDEVTIDLEAQGGSGDYILWTTGSCTGDSVGTGETLTIMRPEETTTYYAHWKNICGTTECSSATIKIIELYSFAVPNAFTPNNDGNNDKFGVISPSLLPVFKFYIFNRWGQLVFSTNDQNEHWDGTYNGNPSPMGAYIWKVEYQYRIEGRGSENHKDQGSVTLIR